MRTAAALTALPTLLSLALALAVALALALALAFALSSPAEAHRSGATAARGVEPGGVPLDRNPCADSVLGVTVIDSLDRSGVAVGGDLTASGGVARLRPAVFR